uniref:GATA-type domain-containing protein n=1 Tax=Steinernema glaseri TaxID=37863 RepID=A0A1I7ZH08_9BILA
MSYEIECYDHSGTIVCRSFKKELDYEGGSLTRAIHRVWEDECTPINSTDLWALVYHRHSNGRIELLYERNMPFIKCSDGSKYCMQIYSDDSKDQEYVDNYLPLPAVTAIRRRSASRARSEGGRRHRSASRVTFAHQLERAHSPERNTECEDSNLRPRQHERINEPSYLSNEQPFNQGTRNECQITMKSNICGSNGQSYDRSETYALGPRSCTIKQRMEHVHNNLLDRMRKEGFRVIGSAEVWNELNRQNELITDLNVSLQAGKRYTFTYIEQSEDRSVLSPRPLAPGQLQLRRAHSILINVKFITVTSFGRREQEKVNFSVPAPTTVLTLADRAKRFLRLEQMGSIAYHVEVCQTRPARIGLNFRDDLMSQGSYEILFVSKELNHDVPSNAFEITVGPNPARVTEPLQASPRNAYPSNGEENLIQKYGSPERNYAPPHSKTLLALSCPVQGCGQDDKRWKCSNCRSSIYYGYDENLYCDRCGKLGNTGLSFKCGQHGNYVPYDTEMLIRKLRKVKMLKR